MYAVVYWFAYLPVYIVMYVPTSTTSTEEPFGGQGTQRRGIAD